MSTRRNWTERGKERVKKITAAALSLGAGAGLLLQTGCAVLLVGGGAAAGIGGYVFVKGELKSTENAPMERVWMASLGAMEELKFPVTMQNKDAVSAQITARTAQDKKVHIALKSVGESSTEIRIRVGTWGDEALSLVIMDKLKKKL